MGDAVAVDLCRGEGRGVGGGEERLGDLGVGRLCSEALCPKPCEGLVGTRDGCLVDAHGQRPAVCAEPERERVGNRDRLPVVGGDDREWTDLDTLRRGGQAGGGKLTEIARGELDGVGV